MSFAFTRADVSAEYKASFRHELLTLIHEHGRSLDRHDPLVNPFEYDSREYNLDELPAKSRDLALFYFDYLQHHVFSELFDELEDDLYEMTAAHHG